jgi:hypothetical protein
MAARHTAAVHVGTPPPDFREWARTYLYYHRFEDLPAHRNNQVSSKVFNCGGFKNVVNLFPGGIDVEEEEADEGMASIVLVCKAHEPINI